MQKDQDTLIEQSIQLESCCDCSIRVSRFSHISGFMFQMVMTAEHCTTRLFPSAMIGLLRAFLVSCYVDMHVLQ